MCGYHTKVFSACLARTYLPGQLLDLAEHATHTDQRPLRHQVKQRRDQESQKVRHQQRDLRSTAVSYAAFLYPGPLRQHCPAYTWLMTCKQGQKQQSLCMSTQSCRYCGSTDSERTKINLNQRIAPKHTKAQTMIMQLVRIQVVLGIVRQVVPA